MKSVDRSLGVSSSISSGGVVVVVAASSLSSSSSSSPSRSSSQLPSNAPLTDSDRGLAGRPRPGPCPVGPGPVGLSPVGLGPVGPSRDLHSSSDTDDCDVDLGVGRLVIDLEADLDTARASRCPPEMRSSSGAHHHQQRPALGHPSGPAAAAPSAGGVVGTRVAPPSERPSAHRSLGKGGPSTNSFLPMTTALGDLADKGIKMRIKCNQSGPLGSTSSGSTTKHEILPYHVPFAPSGSSSSTDNPTASNANRVSNGASRSSSSHKKDRHSTKDRSKTGALLGHAIPGEDSLLTASPTGCSSVSDVAVKPEVGLGDGEGAKVAVTLRDPYEFNMKMEDVVGLPVKKVKLEKCDAASSPFVDHFSSSSSRPDLDQRDAEVDACHIGVITEPECLGPCEPGTSVTLEGIVWNETENGLLVVNVTWRGKTYVGTLMDSTKHHWAPPRFSGDSPTSDFETRTPKGRGKRGRTCAVAQRNEGNGSDRKLRSNRSNKPSTATAAPSPVRNDSSSLKRSRTETASSDGSRGSKCSRSDSRTSELGNGTVGGYAELANGGLIECPEENCSKKYRNLNGLRYHQTRMHKSICPTKENADMNDFVEGAVAVATERIDWRAKPTVMEVPQSKQTRDKPMESEGKTREDPEDVESQVRPAVNGIKEGEEKSTERDTGLGKVGLEVELKAEESPVCTNAEESNEEARGASVIAAGKGTNPFVSINADDSKKLGTMNQLLVALTPASVPARASDDNPDNSAAYQSSSSSTGILGASLAQPAASLPPGSANSEDAKSSGELSKSDGERGKKSKSEKSDRNRVKLPSACTQPSRPVLPQGSSPSSGAIPKPLLLSSCPTTTLQGLPGQQLKPIQPRPLLSSEQANANLAMLTDKSKKRKREKDRPREQPPLLSGATKPLNRPGSSESAQNAPPNTSHQVDYTESGSGQAILIAGSLPGGDSFGQSSESGQLVGQPDIARCSPAPGATSQFPVNSTSSEQPVPSQATPLARPSDSSSNSNQSNIQTGLPPASLAGQQRLLLPVESLSLRPVVVGLQSPLSAMKAVPSSVIKNTSGFEIGSNMDLPNEPKPQQPSTEKDLPHQPLSTERKPTAPPDFTKSGESGGKSHEALHPTSGTNPQLTSPCKKSKSASAKHADANSSSTDFGNPHSPAYSDISDANDNAPVLDAPMLEKEAQAAAEEEEAISIKVSPTHPQDSYVYSPFYGQPPYLTPAVSSSDIPDCGPPAVQKSSLTKPASSSDKHIAIDKIKSEPGTEKRSVPESVPARSRPPAELTLKFPGDHQREQPLRDEKDTREKGGRVAPTSGPARTDLHKPQQHQQHQHKMFSGEAMLPQQAAVMHPMMMPSSYGFVGPQFGYYSQEYSNEMQRIFQLQQQQQQEARRLDQASKSDNAAGDHKTRTSTGKVPADGKPLPTPPSLIPDRNRHDLKDESDRGREKQPENRKPTKDTIEGKNLGEGSGAKQPEGGYDVKTIADRAELQRYCIQSHFLEHQRLSEHQSHKSMMDSGGGGGCKPSAVVAPQARDKNAGVVGNAPMMHVSKRDDGQGRGGGHEGHRSHRDSQKNPPMTPPQQHAMQHKSGAGSATREGTSGRVQKDSGNAKEDSGPSGGRGIVAKGKDEAPMTSLPVSMPTGIPAPYAPYYGHYLPPTPYGGPMPFDPTHAPLYPGMMGYAPAPYIHPQMLSPALAMASADVKPCEILAPTQPPGFFSNEGQTHKIHELKEVAKMQQGPDGSQPSPGNRDPGRPKSSGGSHSSGKDTEHSSPPTQRHVHTHHHMHVVGLPYRFVSSDAAIIASQQAAAATDATQIPRPFLK